MLEVMGWRPGPGTPCRCHRESIKASSTPRRGGLGAAEGRFCGVQQLSVSGRPRLFAENTAIGCFFPSFPILQGAPPSHAPACLSWEPGSGRWEADLGKDALTLLCSTPGLRPLPGSQGLTRVARVYWLVLAVSSRDICSSILQCYLGKT